MTEMKIFTRIYHANHFSKTTIDADDHILPKYFQRVKEENQANLVLYVFELCTIFSGWFILTEVF